MNHLFAQHALLPDGWRDKVVLTWDGSGCLTGIDTNVGQAARPAAACGIVIPGMPNLHSHAFQRAMAGLTEYAGGGDSFWTWRTLMYAFAQRMSPPAMQAIATQLYVEMLKAGYTSVCEFHYLHHDAGGRPYANPAEMAECLLAAAADAGIGITLLPVLYQHGGFGAQTPRPEQARFISSPDWIMELVQRLRRSHPQHAGRRYGLAPHSLRAVSPTALTQLLAARDGDDPAMPLHLHIAEQTAEVDDCVAHLGTRPVQWLLDHAEVDAHWCLVHATHMDATETGALARSGAVAGICPTTEANLGDGIFPGAAYAAAGGAWGIGSDSHVSVDVAEELRLLEYSQRLLLRQRNVLAEGGQGSVGGFLYRNALQGGAAACGRPVAGLAVGQRADLLVLDAAHPDLCATAPDRWLDGFVFGHHGRSPVREVLCGGRWVVRDRCHALDESAAASYRDALRQLLVA